MFTSTGTCAAVGTELSALDSESKATTKEPEPKTRHRGVRTVSCTDTIHVSLFDLSAVSQSSPDSQTTLLHVPDERGELLSVNDLRHLLNSDPQSKKPDMRSALPQTSKYCTSTCHPILLDVPQVCEI